MCCADLRFLLKGILKLESIMTASLGKLKIYLKYVCAVMVSEVYSILLHSQVLAGCLLLFGFTLILISCEFIDGKAAR